MELADDFNVEGKPSTPETRAANANAIERFIGEVITGKTKVETLPVGMLTDAVQGLRDAAAEIERLRSLASTCYAGLGAECNLPDPWLDAFHAAAEGNDFTTEGLLPFTATPAVPVVPRHAVDAVMAVVDPLLKMPHVRRYELLCDQVFAAIQTAVSPPCDVPPDGWTCSRTKGHEGPCAASPAIPADQGIHSPWNACMFRDGCRAQAEDAARMAFLAENWQARWGTQRVSEWLGDIGTLLEHGGLRKAIDHLRAEAGKGKPG